MRFHDFKGLFDPLGRPTITAYSDHYFHICRPSVRPNFSKHKTIFK